ncbi:unnamed protein product, partial [Lampetra planeri]
MGDVPYLAGCPGPEVTAAMAALCCSVRRTLPHRPVGVQILAGANQQALAVALAAGLDFVRVEGFVFAHEADEGLCQAGAGRLLRERRRLEADRILLFADVKKKHSAHAITADVGVVDTALAAGVLLGRRRRAHRASHRMCRQRHGTRRALIVGSHLKRDGTWNGELCPQRAGDFMD